MTATPDPPYWRRRPAPSELDRLAAERWLLLTAGPVPVTAIARPVLDGDRLLLVTPADADLLAQLAADPAVGLAPCDNRGRPRAAGPFDAADPVASTRPAEPVPATARPSPRDERSARVLLAVRHRLAGGAASAVDTLRRLLGRPAAPPLVLEVRLSPPAA